MWEIISLWKVKFYWNFKNGMMNANMAIFVATLAKTICKVEQQHHLNVIKRIKEMLQKMYT